MADYLDQDDEPIAKEDLVRLWAWWPNTKRLNTVLCLKDVADEVLEEKRAEGAHCWKTGPVIVAVNR